MTNPCTPDPTLPAPTATAPQSAAAISGLAGTKAVPVDQMPEAALDYLVATVLGWPVYITLGRRVCLVGVEPTPSNQYAEFSPSTDAREALPILERKRMHLCPVEYNGVPAYSSWPDGHRELTQYGPTALIAAMRSIVVADLGAVVDVPEVLA